MATISGNVKDASGDNAARSLRAYNQATGALAGQAISDPVTGDYTISGLTSGAKYTVVMVDGLVDTGSTYCSLLMYGNGANGGSSFTDEKGHTITRTGSGITTSTTQSKFDGSSIKFTGVAFDALRATTIGSEFTFGSGDFKISAWCFPVAVADYAIIDWRPDGTDGKYPALLLSGGHLVFHRDSGVLMTSAGTLTTGAWNYIEVSREGTNLSLFINGDLDSTITDSTIFLAPGASRPRIGAPGNNSGTQNLNGYLNSLAVYKGFSGNTEAFPELISVRAGDPVMYDGYPKIEDSVVAI